jgi:uncharacterized protein (TIRG00374 family)
LKIVSGIKFLGIAISIITLGVFVYIYGPYNLLKTISSLPPIYLVFFLTALGFHLLSLVFWALRIKYLASVNGQKITFMQSLLTVVSSLFAATLTPGYIGGEPVRIKKLSDYGMNPGSSAALVLGERGFDAIFFIVVLFLIIIGGFISISGPFKLYVYIGGVVLILFLVILIVSMGAASLFKKILFRIENYFTRKDKKEGKRKELFLKIAKEIETFTSSTKTMFIKNPGVVFAGVTITALLWISDFSVPVVLIMGFGITPDILYIIFVQVILVLISLIPITPGAAGIMEVLMLATFSIFLPHGFLVIFIIFWRFITFYFNIILGSFTIHKIVTK